MRLENDVITVFLIRRLHALNLINLLLDVASADGHRTALQLDIGIKPVELLLFDFVAAHVKNVRDSLSRKQIRRFVGYDKVLRLDELAHCTACAGVEVHFFES